MLKKTAGLLLTFTLAILFGCSSGSELASLKSTGWQIDSIAGLTIAPGKKIITLELSSMGNVSGNAGCNNYGGTYTTSGKSIHFMNMYATEKACDNMEMETAYLKALGKADSYKISGGKLKLYGSGSLLAVFFEK